MVMTGTLQVYKEETVYLPSYLLSPEEEIVVLVVVHILITIILLFY